jgi:hypothetical protein
LLEKLLLLFAEFGRRVNGDGNDMRAAAVTFEVGYAVVG